MKNYITKLYQWDSKIKLNNIHIDELNKKNDECKNELNQILNNEQVKLFINKKLQESIDKFGLNDNKENNLYNDITFTSSSNGETIESTYKEVNPRGKFNPYTDKWEILKIDKDKDNRYKISVENIKGRKHINMFMWEPDIYNTDWFELTD